jgi:tape measure domain-containing protein
MFRQQLGGTAEYAASIGKLQIALRGVVGSQEAYDAAIRAAAAATRDLNIPQEEATRGLTRLSAAVIGAGGTVADSSFAFRAMSEAIKATGGNAEQVDGALLALTQVFSKGKVSAEELNQIAERLPGTFTLFAQAAGKTGPELQKALEQGQVGLNDLMKFLALTGERYGTTALEIAPRPRTPAPA